MDILNLIISDMGKEDVRFYKLFANRLYYSHDRKDLQLFDYIKLSGDQYEEDKIIKSLYRQSDKNTFYRLKNRLLNHVNKSLLLQHFEADDSMNVLALLSLYKFHYARNNYKAAKYFLNKAERKALSLEFLELLDIIYSEFIKISIESVDINPDHYIRKRKTTLHHLQKVREIDQVLAAVTYQLKISQNYSQEGKFFVRNLENIIREQGTDKELKNSKLLQVKLVDAVSRVLLQKHDYKTLESFLSGKLKEFRKKKIFSKANHDVLLQMLTYLVNSSFKNKRFRRSLAYTGELHKAMEAFGRLYYDKYFVFYTNAQVINYSVIDPDQAISILEELKKSSLRKKLAFYEMFIYLNLALLYFEKKDFDRSIRQIIDMNLLETFKRADETLKLKISVAELIIRFEMGDWEVIEYRISQIQRRFRSLLQSKIHQQEKEMMLIIRRLMATAMKKSDKKLKDLMRQFIRLHQKQAEEDTAVIKYIPWLKEKLQAMIPTEKMHSG